MLTIFSRLLFLFLLFSFSASGQYWDPEPEPDFPGFDDPVAPPPAAPPQNNLKGYISYTSNAAQTRCVANVESSFNRIRRRSTVMGFHKGAYSGSNFWHWQGIARMQNGSSSQYMVVTNSSRNGAAAGFGIIKMATRNTTGEMYRSNRFSTVRKFKDQAPSSSDTIVKYVYPRSSVTNRYYNHIGGTQVYGNILAIAAEGPTDGSNTTEILFYDISNPANPVQKNYSISSTMNKAGSVSFSKLDNGTFLLMVERNSNLYFYSSSTTSLDNNNTTFSLFEVWDFDVDGFGTGSIDNTWPSSLLLNSPYQAYTQLVQCDGTIYMLATHNEGPTGLFGRRDWADLYRLAYSSGTGVVLTKVGKKHLKCTDLNHRACDLAASGGTYVDPNGELILYATEHYMDGPSGTIKMTEFAAEPTSCPTIDDAWVELFKDDTYNDRHLLIDYVDRNRKPYNNYTYESMESFNDKASSVRWCIPSGSSMKLYQHNTYSGSVLTLSGSGSVQSHVNLNHQNFGDKISSSRFIVGSGDGGAGGTNPPPGDDFEPSCPGCEAY